MARSRLRSLVALGPLENDPRELHRTRECECVARKHLQREPAPAGFDVRLGKLARALDRVRRSVRDRLEQRSCRCHGVVMVFGVVSQNAGNFLRATEDSNL
jgi:hypothetical protein